MSIAKSFNNGAWFVHASGAKEFRNISHELSLSLVGSEIITD